MADQTRKGKPRKDEETAEPTKAETTEKKDEELDDLLDEIDEVLEVNSEDFVRAYIQKGGELMIPSSLMMQGRPMWMSVVLMVVGYTIWRRQRSHAPH
ncbi:MAG: prokaryotic ubiquitin-like protein Pup [Actinomycetota bacterium]|jgi:ubiquitin-like protein Pup|nr:prokaryotic ubiquitin-like protein Pup [Actinomycetota bacterium]